MMRKTKPCEKCNQNISLSNIKKHIEKCKGEINYWSKKRKGLIATDDDVICIFCKKQLKNANSKRNHQRLCKLNPHKQFTTFQIDREKIKKSKENFSNQFEKARFFGLSVPSVSEETRKKLSLAHKNLLRNPEKQKDIAEKISDTVSKKLIEGKWHTYHEVKKIVYNNIKFDSSWEVKYAQWLDENNIRWERCNKRFPYIFEGVKKHYIPDFYLPHTDEYVEIKGMILEKDYAKWEQFSKTNKLTILYEVDLKNLGIL
jgi:hypothetical protein